MGPPEPCGASCGKSPSCWRSSSDGEPHAASQDFVTVHVEMKEFAFTPAVIRVPRGWPARVIFINRGQLAHQFETAPLRLIPVTVVDDMLRVESVGLEHLRVQPGGTASLFQLAHHSVKEAMGANIDEAEVGHPRRWDGIGSKHGGAGKMALSPRQTE